MNMFDRPKTRGFKVNTGGTIGALASGAIAAFYIFFYIEPNEAPINPYLAVSLSVFGGAYVGRPESRAVLLDAYRAGIGAQRLVARGTRIARPLRLPETQLIGIGRILSASLE